MQITNIDIQNYRNISSSKFYPAEGMNVFWGDNGQGKTNILEIIYLLGTLKSFRGGINNDFIKFNEKAAFLKATVSKKKVSHDIDLKIYPTAKKLLFDGKNVSNYKDFFSCLRAVIFSPEEILTVKGPPSLRRALLDRAIFQLRPAYLDKVRAYDLCLRQRNKALQGRLSVEEITPWTEALINAGVPLRLERFRYLQEIRSTFRSTYGHISGNQEEVDIGYPAGGDNQEHLADCLRRELAKGHKKELFQCMTLAGPHRDEVDFTLAQKPVKNFGSQGQQRSCILAFKTAQVKILEKNTAETPVLLLDDLNSELDRKRQDFYFEFLLARSGQVFITTTDPQPFSARKLKDATFFQVVNGRIIPATE